HRDEWFQGNNLSTEQAFLDKAIKSKNYLKLGKQKKYAFGFTDADIIVETEFDVFPKSGKLDNLRKSLNQIKDNCQHKFDALHDSLTGCKNRKSFERAMLTAIEDASRPPSVEDASLQQSGAPSVNLITADIDF